MSFTTRNAKSFTNSADVVVNRAPLMDGVDDGREIVVGQHHLRGLLGGLRALTAHGDADIGLLQRGRVVDAVAGHGHHRADRLQGSHDPQLVLRIGAREDMGRQRQGRQGRVGDRVELGASSPP